MQKGKLIVFSAPSGSGKSTIVNYLMQHHPELHLAFSISCTSRAPRGTERNGVEYFFLSPDEFKEKIEDGGFFLCHWDGTAETEARIKEETQATIRCVPFGVEQTPGVDMVSGKPAVARVLIARSY